MDTEKKRSQKRTQGEQLHGDINNKVSKKLSKFKNKP